MPLTIEAVQRSLPDEAALDLIESLGDQAQFCRAWECASRLAPLSSWRGPRARCIAAWLAVHLGAPRLAARIQARAFREAPNDARVIVMYSEAVLEQRGPLAAWSLLAHAPVQANPPHAERAELLFARGRVLALLRDFESAHATIREGEAIAPDHHLGPVTRALMLEQQDRVEDALSIASRALEARPRRRVLLQLTAHYLVLLNRAHDALEILKRGAEELESAVVALQLASVERELRRYGDARLALQRYAELSPLMEPRVEDDLNARISEIAYRSGDIAEAISRARLVRAGPVRELADRMERAAESAKSVELDVPFVRQHRLTCVPATLTAISRHWGMQTEHLSVAEAICYDGTPVHSARAWADQNGWRAGEFTITWDAARLLIDRGVPFVLMTAFAAEGHAQAIVGYDEKRGSFFVRDPSNAGICEADAGSLLRAFRSTGPRGMWLVPRDQMSRLEGLSLPDAPLWDRLFAEQAALGAHDRITASQQLDALRGEAAEHDITLAARRALAAYDLDWSGLRVAAESTLGRYPGDARAELDVSAAMHELSPRADRIARLEIMCARLSTDPIFRERLADELHEDAREHARAARLLRRAMRARPHRARPLLILANIAWLQCRFDDALALYRFAACVDDTNEEGCRAYFTAARMRGLVERALVMMRERAKRLGNRSSLPIQTLHWALEQLDRAAEASEVLEAGLDRRSDDGELLLYAAHVLASSGSLERAEELLARADGRTSRTQWLRSAAGIAHILGQPQRRLKLLQEVLAIEPLAVDAHRGVVAALAATEGPEAATSHLQAAVERFPNNRPLLQLFAEWSARSGPEAREMAARRVLASCPSDAWAHRELALALSDSGKTAEALAACDQARSIDPNNPSLHLVFGAVSARAGRPEDARAAWKKAIEAWADSAIAIHELVSDGPDRLTRQADLAFAERELQARAVDGAGVLAWYDMARAELPDDEVLTRVSRIRATRPDLWPAWSIHVRELIAHRRLEDARSLASEAAERFPLIARAWVDLADVARTSGDSETEIRALERSVAVAPLDATAVATLAALLEQKGATERARTLLERTVTGLPDHAGLTVALAGLLDRMGRPADAVERLKRALSLNPEPHALWRCLYGVQWKLGRAEEALEYARALARDRPWSAPMASNLAHLARAGGTVEEALTVLDRVIAVHPKYASAHDERAILLAEAGRVDEAVAACKPAAFGGKLPIELRGRLAWLKMRKRDAAGGAADLKAMLEAHPSYAWGWAQLVDACTALGDTSGRVAAAERLVRLVPDNADAHRLLGEARLANGERDSAKGSWRRAATLEAGNASLFRLVRSALEDGDVERAEGWLAALRMGAGERALPSEVRVALRRGDASRAVVAFREACASQALSPDVVARTRQLLVFAGLGEEAYRVLEELATAPEGSPVAAYLWALTSIERGDKRAVGWLLRTTRAEGAARAAAKAALTRLNARDRRARLRWLAWRMPRALRRAPDVRKTYAGLLARPPLRAPGRGQALRRAATAVLAAALIAPLAIGFFASSREVPSAIPVFVAFLVVRFVFRRR